MDKRNHYILIGAGAILIFLIALTMALSPKQQPAKQNLQTGQPASQITANEQLPPPTSRSTLEEAAKGFYDWYVSHPNPLGSGEYQKSPYISAEYKKTLSGFVIRGDHLNSEPVLTCVGIKPPKNIKTQRELYNDTQQMAYVFLQEDVQGAKPLYKIIFKKLNQQWFIDDIRCVL